MQQIPQKTPQTRTPYEQTQLARYGVANPELFLQEDAPVEYITQVCESNGMLFHVTQQVLIPRIETQELVEKVVARFVEAKTDDANGNGNENIRIIDIGTGSGFLGICVAKMIAELFIDVQIELLLCDISVDALDVARQNAKNLLPDSVDVTFVESDLLDGLKNKELLTQQPFDIILANLPYIPSVQISKLDSSVKKYEPLLALDGGPDGFRLISKFLKQTPSYMNQSSKVWLEVDPTHTVKLCTLAQPDLKYLAHLDSFGKHRFIEAKKK